MKALRQVAIEATGLEKSYADTPAVRDVSLVAAPGEVTVVVGGNGAGKSTTLALVLGLLRGPGEVRFGGRALTDHPAPHRVVGAFLGQPGMHPRRSAAAHLRMLGVGTGVGAERRRALLAEVGLAGCGRRAPRTFSTGMRQRLGLAAAVLHDPSVLVLDEPLNGLDPDGVLLLRAMVRRHAERGGTVLMASHQLDEVERLADSVVVMDAGRVVQQAALAEVAAPQDLLVVVSDDDERLAVTLQAAGADLGPGPGLVVGGLDARTIAGLAHETGILITGLSPLRRGLTDAFESGRWARRDTGPRGSGDTAVAGGRR